MKKAYTPRFKAHGLVLGALKETKTISQLAAGTADPFPMCCAPGATAVKELPAVFGKADSLIDPRLPTPATGELYAEIGRPDHACHPFEKKVPS